MSSFETPVARKQHDQQKIGRQRQVDQRQNHDDLLRLQRHHLRQVTDQLAQKMAVNMPSETASPGYIGAINQCDANRVYSIAASIEFFSAIMGSKRIQELSGRSLRHGNRVKQKGPPRPGGPFANPAAPDQFLA